MAKKELQVSAIENGTVIDHIPADKLFDVINVLGITGMDNAMTFGANLKSSKLALVAPSAKINIIRDYDVVEKKTVNVPEKVEGIVKCMNPKCITNHEKVRTKFTEVKDSPIVLKCHYCEKLTDQEHMEMN